MKKLTILLTCLILIFISCASSPTDSFLINQLDENEKSDIVAKKGRLLYSIELEKGNNYSAIPKVKKHFDIALEMNPDNGTAQNYLNKIDRYKERNIQKNLKASRKYFNKGDKRTEQDNFNTCYFLRGAIDIDPTNEEVIALKKETTSLRRALVKTYIKTGDGVISDALRAKDINKKKKLSVEAIDQFGRTLLIDPDNGTAKKSKQKAQKILFDIMTEIINDTNILVEKMKYTNSRGIIKKLKYYDAKVDGQKRKDIQNLEYKLYYAWANYHYSNKKYELAERKIRSALSALRVKEGQTFQRKIIAMKKKSEVAASFDTWIVDIDELLTQKEYSSASKKVKRLLSKVTGGSKKNQLLERESTLVSLLPEIYNSAVEKYTSENFIEAIDAFETVLEIKSNYENAKDYLDKARTKQKLLEAF